MIPLRDENPTHRPALVTWAIIVICVGVYTFVQPSSLPSVYPGNDVEKITEEIRFTYRWAAIPCEITRGRPLTVEEIGATQIRGDMSACRDRPRGRTAFPGKWVWSAVIVSMFLHGSWLHLGGNMIFLWIFGNNIEDHLGHLRYLAFYLVSGVVATAAHVVADPRSTVPLVGASGAIAGVLGAYAVWFPWARVRCMSILFIIPVFFDMRAAWLLGVWFVSQFFTAPGSGVAWLAHVGGFVFGVLVGLYARTDARFRRRLWVQRYATLTGAWDNRSGPG